MTVVAVADGRRFRSRWQGGCRVSDAPEDDTSCKLSSTFLVARPSSAVAVAVAVTAAIRSSHALQNGKAGIFIKPLAFVHVGHAEGLLHLGVGDGREFLRLVSLRCSQSGSARKTYRAKGGGNGEQRPLVRGRGLPALQQGLARIHRPQGRAGVEVDFLRLEAAVGGIGDDANMQESAFSQPHSMHTQVETRIRRLFGQSS